MLSVQVRLKSEEVARFKAWRLPPFLSEDVLQPYRVSGHTEQILHRPADGTDVLIAGLVLGLESTEGIARLRNPAPREGH